MAWESNFGGYYETEDQARDSIHEYIEIEDYADRIDMLNSDLLEIILRKCPEEIESKLLDAEELFFKENYYEVEGEQE